MLDMLKGKVTKEDWVYVGSIIAVTVVLALALYYFLILAEQKKTVARRQQLDAVTVELEGARKIEKNITALRDEKVLMAQLFDDFQKRLPEEREIPNLLQRFEKMGGEIGLRLEMVPIETKIEKRIETIPFRVKAKGQFHQVVAFINLLESDERYLKVSDIDIGEEKDGVSEANFVLSTFRFLPDKEENVGGAKGVNQQNPAQNTGKSAANGPAK
jgi:Tfp pilus assembly protein PilO